LAIEHYSLIIPSD